MFNESGQEPENYGQVSGTDDVAVPSQLTTLELLRFISAEQEKSSARAEKVANEANRLHLETLSAIKGQSKVALWIAAAVALVTLGQWVTSILNNKGNGQQTKKLITAANLSSDAAQKNLQAAQNFAESARGINQGVGDAVGRLQAQAKGTQELASRALEQAKASEKSAGVQRASYEATVRPYLGQTLIPLVKDNVFQVDVVFQNFGTIPAENVSLNWIMLVDGRQVAHMSEVTSSPFTIFPTDNSRKNAKLRASGQRILDGKSSLVVYTFDRYQWRDKTQQDCNKYEYSTEVQTFYRLGKICYPEKS